VVQQRPTAIDIVGQSVFHATATGTATDAAACSGAAAATAATPDDGRRPGRAVESDQAKVAHAATTSSVVDDAAKPSPTSPAAAAAAATAAATATAATSSPAAATAPTAVATPTATTGQPDVPAGRRRMELVFVFAAGHHAGHCQQAVRFRPGIGQSTGRGHAETPAAAHTGVQGIYAVPRHTTACSSAAPLESR